MVSNRAKKAKGGQIGPNRPKRVQLGPNMVKLGQMLKTGQNGTKRGQTGPEKAYQAQKGSFGGN